MKSRIETLIRKSPYIYKILRHLVPYVNQFYSVESEFQSLRLFKPYINEGICVDVGFNDGISTISILRNSKSKIVAFEPLEIKLDPITTMRIRKNVLIYNVGISDVEEVTQLYVPKVKKRKFIAYSSSDFESARDNLIRDMNVDHNDISFEEIVMRVQTLDSFNFPVKFLKVDTEGSELKVIRGAKKTIEKFHPIIIIEANSESEFRDLINSSELKNYEFYIWQNKTIKKANKYILGVRNYILLPSELSLNFS